MLSIESLELVELIARTGSFTAAAKALHRVPSAVSYAVRNIEEELGVVLFTRQHRRVAPTEAGQHFVIEARGILNKMEEIRRETRRVANGWQPSLSIALDNIVSSHRINALMADFYRHFDNVELIVRIEVFNGVWEALATGRADIAIGATTAVPVGGEFSFRDMGSIEWAFLASPHHPLGDVQAPLSTELLATFPSICLEDTAREIPRRDTWLLPNQRRLVVPDWQRAINCFVEGLGIGYMPVHLARPFIESGRLVEKTICNPKTPSPCCVAWHSQKIPPVLSWVLDYLGDSEKLHAEWIS
ncbi:putative HTH-type transcriptional regulator YahB [Paraburkholderia caffeinitolerans]|uniref:Putative HTH-type transcriptional regulator YahB n=1 Tax=Paraburkholderia caffeinitolerans TaxID=1723730 RepID=A0A6J5FUW9_9BURK|nr:DNA-binding transcriptional activator PunR [Paraburkholderia caffeinitolerans]CAB3785925.1 putative HTH-type transcriptional regulator YahB [Paraburkholderia caffeinitolerans]